MMKIIQNKHNEVLEIYDIDGGGNGWTIQLLKDGKCELFEITGLGMDARSSGEFPNVYDALKIAKSWT